MSLLQDLRFAFRMMARTPAFTSVIVLALALGIGANTAVFTLAYAVLFRGLPFADAHEIMHLENNNLERGRDSVGVSFPDYEDWRKLNRSFQDLAAFDGQIANLSDGEFAAERYSASMLTANTFRVIGQAPIRGRDFSEEDAIPGAPPVVILGHGIWKSRYGQSDQVFGRVVRINEVPTTIIGVMAEGMEFPSNDDLWLPMRREGNLTTRSNRTLEVFGRLKEGVSLEEAREDMSLLAAQLAEQYPDTNQGFGAVVKPYNEEFNGGPIRLVFLVMMGAVGFVLLIACANVANLLLARSTQREREVSIRCALGAGRWRVIRQMLVESVLLGLLGGAVGLFLAWVGVRVFENAVSDVGKPYWIVFEMDVYIFLYLAAICLLTALLCGLVPAIKASRTDPQSYLQEGGRSAMLGAGSRRLSSALVVAQLALAVILLVGAGLMVRSLLNASRIDAGFPTEGLMAFRIALPEAKYEAPETRLQFHDALLERLKAIPGVEAAAFTSNLPLGGSGDGPMELEGSVLEPQDRPEVRQVWVSPDYFSVLDARLLRGRTFKDADDTDFVVVNDRFVERYLPDEDPVGKRLRLGSAEDRPWLTVIGVTSWIRQNSPDDPQVDPVIYLPYRQRPFRFLSGLVRSPLESGALAGPIRAEVATLDPNLPVYDAMSLQQQFYENNWPWRVFGSVFSVFGLIALFLSAIGLYAVIAYSVSRRTHEIGVRMALGASGRAILRSVASQGGRQLLLGLILGIAGGLAVSRVMQSLLVQVSPTDPVTFTVVVLVLSAGSLAACLLPARRASRIDPIRALRVE